MRGKIRSRSGQWSVVSGPSLVTHHWSLVTRRQGQSTLEYVLILAAIILAVAVFGKRAVTIGTENAMADAKKVMDEASNRLALGVFGTSSGPFSEDDLDDDVAATRPERNPAQGGAPGAGGGGGGG